MAQDHRETTEHAEHVADAHQHAAEDEPRELAAGNDEGGADEHEDRRGVRGQAAGGGRPSGLRPRRTATWYAKSCSGTTAAIGESRSSISGRTIVSLASAATSRSLSAHS